MTLDAYGLLHKEILNPLADEVGGAGDHNSFFGSLYAYGETHYDRCLVKHVPQLVEAYKSGGRRELERTWEQLNRYELQYCGCGITGVDGVPYKGFEDEVAENAYRADIAALIHRTLHQYQSWSLSSEQGDNPLALLTDVLQDGITEIGEIIHHRHKWNEDGYCFICGIDGHA